MSDALTQWLASARAKVEAAKKTRTAHEHYCSIVEVEVFAACHLPALLDVAEAAGVLSDDVAEMSSCSCPGCANVRVLPAAPGGKGGE